jgi:Domain of unknown function (DUF4188)
MTMSQNGTGRRVQRRTVDLSGYPDLIVIYLGMRVNALHGLKRLIGLGPQIQTAAGEKPDGLLLHENLVYGLFPPHMGMRQYWRDWDSLEVWSRSEPHRRWWQEFLRDSGGTGFWHETYFMRGGMESIFDDMKKPVGLLQFAPSRPARGRMFGARRRLGLGGEAIAPVVAESELYEREPAVVE